MTPQRTPTATVTTAPTATPSVAAAPSETVIPGALYLTPVADARVAAAAPDTNYGTSSRLRVDSGQDPAVESYLRFTVSGLTAPPTQAVLRVFATTDSRIGPTVAAAGSEWSETGITWTTRPASTGGVMGTAGPVAINSWIEVDVSAAVTGDGAYTFVLSTSSSDGIDLSSRESAANRPRLVLTLPDHTISPSPTPTATRAPVSEDSAVVLAAGDIASCQFAGDEATGALVAAEPGTILALGDLAYESGTAAEFADCYDPSWGGVKERTYPVPGNHEYATADAAGYFAYFGERAGDPAKGYYSFDLGAWHIVALNSNCAAVGGCEAGSPQETWLRADLAANPTRCTLAYLHYPLFSSGLHGNNPGVRALWQALYDSGTELVLAGHDHHYERFAPQDPAGTADPAGGIREFVLGTGGMRSYTVETRQANSEVIEPNVFGVLQLVLRPDGYDWTFLSAGDTIFTDSGSESCHDPLPTTLGEVSSGAHAQTLTLGAVAMVAPRTAVMTRRRVRRRSR